MGLLLRSRKASGKATNCEGRAQASLIFTGRVESVALVEKTDTVHFRTRAGADTMATSRRQYLQFTFAVTQQLKGQAVAGTVAVLTATSGAACGTSFRVGAVFWCMLT